jgi:hypothetical protein
MDRRTFLAAVAATTAAPAAFAGGHGRLFSFHGINNHTVTGTAEIVGTTVNLLDDFVFDGAPDPRIALGNDGVYDPKTLQTLVLQPNQYEGSSSWELPAGVNPDDYNEVWVWCEKFTVGLAIATAK